MDKCKQTEDVRSSLHQIQVISNSLYIGSHSQAFWKSKKTENDIPETLWSRTVKKKLLKILPVSGFEKWLNNLRYIIFWFEKWRALDDKQLVLLLLKWIALPYMFGKMYSDWWCNKCQHCLDLPFIYGLDHWNKIVLHANTFWKHVYELN